MFKCIGKGQVFTIILFLALAIPGMPHVVQAALIKAEAIKNLISDHVEKNMPWPPGAVRVDFPARIADVFLPAEKVNLEVQNRPDEDYIAETVFIVKFFSDGTLIKEEAVRVRLEVLTDVVVTVRALEKNKEIAAEDVKVLKKWVRRIPANGVTTPAEVIGKALTLNLGRNREITRNVIRPPILIKKGNRVRIVLDKENLNVTTIGVSEEDGEVEKVIRVKNSSSNKTIYARVTGNSLVKVEY
ncbi:MAG TPA: flagellar basal body P-ring formation chaperone FlgA [Syntrophales bacterium]|nr:flagellar basal body P-ring formation chaperone FlgA [Syntrophales bacterium]